MLNLGVNQTALVASTSKAVIWHFYITDKNGTVYTFVSSELGGIAWATGIVWDSGVVWDGGEALSSIVLTDFSGITLSRNKAEQTIIAPSETTFKISDAGNTLTFSDFNGGSVLITLYLAATGYPDTKIAAWKFNIKKAEPGYQNIRITCEDFIRKYMRGDYPNTAYPQDLFPSSANYEDAHGSLCVPVPFGTAYVPLRPVYLSNPHTYVDAVGVTAAVASASGSRCKITASSGLDAFKLGTPVTVAGFANSENNGYFIPLSISATEMEFDTDTGFVDEVAGAFVTINQGDVYFCLGSSSYTYTINRMRSPRSVGDASVWISTSTTFAQTTHADAYSNDQILFQPIIADCDKDGTNESPGFWRPGDNLLDAPVRFTRSDTASMTNPADVINFVLQDMGVPSTEIDATTFASAKATYTSWGLTFNGAFWYKQSREKVLAILLTMCHSCLRIGEKIELHVLSKTSQKTITASEILRNAAIGEGTFRYGDVIADHYSDCGYIAWQKDYAAQDSFLKLLVPAKTTSTVISNDVIELPFIQDSQDAQRAGTLHYQRKFLKTAIISFTANGTCMALQPDDVVTIDNANYGGTYAALIDSMTINKDLSIAFQLSVYSSAFDDWGDLSPAAATIPSDDTAYAWQPSISGPQTDQNIGRTAYDLWGKEYLKVSPTANAGEYTDLQKALNAVKQAGGGAIYLLNGTYQMTAPLYVPNVNIEVVGESQGGVILKNKAGDDLFVLHNLAKTFKFSAFTITSQNVASFSKMFNIYGDSISENTANIFIDNISIASAVSGVDEHGIYVYKCNGALSVSNSLFEDGASAIRADAFTDGVMDIKILHNIIKRAYKPIQAFASANGRILIDGNTIKDFYGYTAVETGSGAKHVNVINNHIEFDDSKTLPATTKVIHFYAALGQIHKNTVIVAAQASEYSCYGIWAEGNVGAGGYCDKSLIIANTVKLDCVTSLFLGGIYASGINDCQVSNNNIIIDNTDTTNNHYGIRSVTSDRNIIQGNSIDMTNNDAKDIGIALDANSDNNQGGDNITYNAGVAISDLGAGNAVTGKDV